MRSQKRPRTFSNTLGNPIIAKPEIIVAIRRLLQHACEHPEFRLIDAETLRGECSECGYQTPEIERGRLLTAIR